MYTVVYCAKDEREKKGRGRVKAAAFLDLCYDVCVYFWGREVSDARLICFRCVGGGALVCTL